MPGKTSNAKNPLSHSPPNVIANGRRLQKDWALVPDRLLATVSPSSAPKQKRNARARNHWRMALVEALTAALIWRRLGNPRQPPAKPAELELGHRQGTVPKRHSMQKYSPWRCSPCWREYGTGLAGEF